MMPNKLQAWLVWLAATSFVFFQFLLQTSTSVMIPAFMREFHIDPLQVGILSSSYFYSYLTMQIPAGMLVDRFGARLVLSVGILLCMLGCWLFAHADNFYIAQFSRILMGLGSAPVIGTTFALVAHWFPPYRFALIIGLTDTLGMLGGVTGQAYLANWVEDIGWRSTMLGCFFTAIVIAIVIVTTVRDNAHSVHTTTENDHPFTKLKKVIQSPQIWWNGIYVAVIWGVAIGFTGLWSVPFLQSQYHLSLALAASASSMVFVGIAIATPITGWLADMFIEWRRKLMLGWTIIGLTTLTLALYAPQLPLVLIFILLFIFGCSSSSYIISFAIVREITAPAARATAMSFTNMMSLAVGSPLLQPLIGYFLKDNSSTLLAAKQTATMSLSNFKLAFIMLPVCLVIGLVSLLFIRQEK